MYIRQSINLIINYYLLRTFMLFIQNLPEKNVRRHCFFFCYLRLQIIEMFREL